MIFFKKHVAMDIVNECCMFLKRNIKLKYINFLWSIKIVIIVGFDKKKMKIISTFREEYSTIYCL